MILTQTEWLKIRMYWGWHKRLHSMRSITDEKNLDNEIYNIIVEPKSYSRYHHPDSRCHHPDSRYHHPDSWHQTAATMAKVPSSIPRPPQFSVGKTPATSTTKLFQIDATFLFRSDHFSWHFQEDSNISDKWQETKLINDAVSSK